ncbi:hypothetical protein GCM10012282_20910 [Streptomyces lacrimifluminis]|uniref:Uncharacterized protein n=1 Tax=Streptomyces lacrimifluminis TaxID=1500077 RepID=A0A917NSR4_9ACTN|nr:hypothetical protein GCM10012282_20910 [Streptomyces lacrimifluminis]
MTRIAERVDIGTTVVIPHGPHEQGGPPGGVVSHSPENLIQGERLLPNGNQLDGLQSRLLTGMIIEGCHTPMVPRTELPARPAFEDEAVQADSGSLGAAAPRAGTGRGGGGEKPTRTPPLRSAAEPS